MLVHVVSTAELSEALSPLLSLAPFDSVLEGFRKLFNLSADDSCHELHRIVFRYRNYEGVFAELMPALSGGASCSLKFRLRPGSWHRMLEGYPLLVQYVHRPLLRDLRSIVEECVAIGLNQTTVERGFDPLDNSPSEWIDIHPIGVTRSDWEMGNQLSPLHISLEQGIEYWHVNLMFDATCFKREGGKTVLQDNWRDLGTG